MHYSLTENNFPFKFENFVIDPAGGAPLEIIEKIFKYHMLPMWELRLRLNGPIWASQHSSYRSKEWETAKDRDPESTGRDWSQHTFVHLGATDWTCQPTDWREFLRLLVTHSPYKRLAHYGDFIHGDYKTATGPVKQADRIYYDQSWNRITEAEFLSLGRY